MEMYALIVDWRSPTECRVTNAVDGQDGIAEVLAGLARALRSHALDHGKATVVLTLKDKSAAGAAARKTKQSK